jgi:hypothetical protein
VNYWATQRKPITSPNRFFFDQLVFPADKEILLKAVENNFQSGKQFLLEIQLLHKAGGL